MSTEQTTGEERVKLHNKKMAKRYDRGLLFNKNKEVNDKDKKQPSS